ncbi:hypothetical protein ROZALSC1DRAFT_29440 [Rozella allomycis CSF55]|uniref:Uncharacterized protein n=1 Tax=Rozella allomycis (strain CSF55) TaxID=988480 RepID=A0A075B508_ROZAC|nr:hypothetical protein O9G_006193 [Rozella allomycis CSF55]RKP18916.1 hypothetical protein ROZALSC1DRAFT_29440 [Rozella allomycis CSF55]|eukprot:EPZ36623.1 hypothetical protein O9G_006193 [Rozella allomycis CSF55]
MVNFAEKYYNELDRVDSEEESDSNDFIEFKDEFGRNRVLPKDEYEKYIADKEQNKNDDINLSKEQSLNEIEKESVEDDSIDNLGPRFYDESKEIRTKGISYYKFSLNPEERAKQQEELEVMRKQTRLRREMAERQKAERKRRIEARLANAQKRKQMSKSFADELPIDPDEENEMDNISILQKLTGEYLNNQ